MWCTILNNYLINCVFYAPELEDGRAYCFCPVCHSVILSFCPPLWNFNLDNNFWTVSSRALIFHISIPCDKTFQWVPFFFYSFTYTFEFDPFLNFENFNLSNNFWTVVALELCYLTRIFLVIRPFRRYHYFLPCDLNLGVWPIFWKL